MFVPLPPVLCRVHICDARLQKVVASQDARKMPPQDARSTQGHKMPPQVGARGRPQISKGPTKSRPTIFVRGHNIIERWISLRKQLRGICGEFVGICGEFETKFENKVRWVDRARQTCIVFGQDADG